MLNFIYKKLSILNPSLTWAGFFLMNDVHLVLLWETLLSSVAAKSLAIRPDKSDNSMFFTFTVQGPLLLLTRCLSAEVT